MLCKHTSNGTYTGLAEVIWNDDSTNRYNNALYTVNERDIEDLSIFRTILKFFRTIYYIKDNNS